MTDVPKRLLDDRTCDPVVRALLEEATAETNAAAKAKTLAALGLGAAAAGTVAMGPVAGAAPGSATSAGGATAASAGAGGASVLKAALGIVAVGIVCSGVAIAIRAPTSAPPPASTPPTPRTASSVASAAPPSSLSLGVPVEALPSATMRPATDSRTVEGDPSRAVRPAMPPASVQRAPASAAPLSTASSTTSSLVEEAGALEAARVVLGAGRAASALGALDAYDQRFPRGELRPEATALRVEALMASGEAAAARSLGAAFLATHPRHPAAARVRRVVDEPRP